MVVCHLTCGFVLCTSVHIQAVSGLELLSTLLTGDNFPHVGFYVVPHVLSDLTKLATDKALQLTLSVCPVRLSIFLSKRLYLCQFNYQ